MLGPLGFPQSFVFPLRFRQYDFLVGPFQAPSFAPIPSTFLSDCSGLRVLRYLVKFYLVESPLKINLFFFSLAPNLCWTLCYPPVVFTPISIRSFNSIFVVSFSFARVRPEVCRIDFTSLSNHSLAPHFDCASLRQHATMALFWPSP